jgi:hypothetical protein
MANNRIGCSAGKTSLIDPNNFSGQGSFDNISVPLEDLNISVQLSTFKKGRTLLTADKTVKTSESSKTVSVTFIEGTEVNGQKVLTSKFTDLTTVFDKNNDSSENLGITNIDVDFNSSYAPMITINFLDLRGSSIFQNESQLNNSENKYSVFFQLPYPLYELTIKGYYGQPVKYCLHMTKFNSKFNSQTGNFEITANFIGYTYAMLSDMLLGILKANAYTKLGGIKYEEIKRIQPKMLNLNELMIQIAKINSDTNKISANDPDSILIGTNNTKLAYLDAIEKDIIYLAQTIDYNKTLDSYDYIIINEGEYTDDIIKGYKTAVGGNVEKFNSNYKYSLDIDTFKEIDGYTYVNLTLGTLNPNTNILTPEQQTALSSLKIGPNGSSPTLDEKKAQILSVANTRNLSSDTFKFRVVDLKVKNNLISNVRNKINKDNEQAKQRLALTLKRKIAGSLGFDPTIRNIVNIFTTAVEIYLSVMFDVSHDAETSLVRKNELKKAFSLDGNSDLKKKETDKFYPWPDYRENTATDGFKEKYLGYDGVLNNQENVDELVYINDLYSGFIKAKQISDAAILDIQTENTTWVSVNPFDTTKYIETSPYNRILGNSNNEVLRLLSIRAMTFLGYTNSDSILEVGTNIQKMAEFEGRAILKDIKNKLVRDSLANTTLEEIVNVKGKTDMLTVATPPSTGNVNIIKKSGNDYIYDYMISGGEQKYLPIGPPYEGNVLDYFNFDNGKETIYLFNYDNKGNPFTKDNEYAKFLDILPLDEYEPQTSLTTLIESEEETKSQTNELIYEKLVNGDVKQANFNVFGGIYGVQEFKNMKWSDTTLNADTTKETSQLPLKYVFFSDFKDKNKKGWSFSRKKTGLDLNKAGDTTTDSYYDHNSALSKNRIPKNIDEARKSKTQPELHGKFGWNRLLGKGIESNYSEISYPYVEYSLKVDDNDYPMSLFGSKFYYLQNQSSCLLNNGTSLKCTNYSKAFLFLNALPWNGNGLEKPEIKHLFDTVGGFIHAPRLWCAWIGALLWRDSSLDPIFKSGEIVGGGSGTQDPIKWYRTTGIPTNINIPIVDTFSYPFTQPNKTEFFSNITNGSYDPLNPILTNLPKSVKIEFKKYFFDFVNGRGQFNVTWGMLKGSLEIWEGDDNVDYNDFLLFFNNITDKTSTITEDNGTYYVDLSAFNSSLYPKFRNTSWDNYNIIAPFGTGTLIFDSYLYLEVNDGNKDRSTARDNLINSLRDEVVMVNSGYAIWLEDNNTPNNFRPIKVSISNYEAYMNAVIKVLKTGASSDYKQEQEAAQEIFGNTDKNVIKHQLYKTCKNVYDKWIGGATNKDNIIFQCGGATPIRNGLDKKIAANKRKGDIQRLIDSFRFVSRSFKDIGDEFFIDTRPVYTYLHDNPNSSFYGCITDLLASNNFDFIALPSFINYNEPSVMESIFEPYSYHEHVADETCGPSFVCVYVGQKSKHLDFTGSDYDNDGFDVQCLPNGSMNPNIPVDFKNNNEKYENNVAVFKVGYSQQNQNIFKDIILDQSEFTETEESLKIIDDISKTGSENQKHFGGQNLYSVYGVRSYKAEVEMMGNAMIQPMMYFQLDNIPMFHGAYMITHVKHSIKPNYMSTNFTGVRIRHPETPLIKSSELYMSLLDGMGYGDSTANGGYSSNSNFNYSSKVYGPLGSNNPGNIICTTKNTIKGSSGCASGRNSEGNPVGPFQQFNDILFGIQASLQITKGIIGNPKSNKDGFKGDRDTLLTFIMVYAPPNENNVNQYVTQVGDKIKKTVATFKYNTLTDVDSTLTTKPVGVGWEIKDRVGVGSKYVKLNSLKNSTALLPDNNSGTGGTNLGDVKNTYIKSNGTDTNSYVLLRELVASKYEKESSAGSLVKVLSQKQFWSLWSNKYYGDKSILDWGSFSGNTYMDKLLTTKQNVNDWKKTLPPDLKFSF